MAVIRSKGCDVTPFGGKGRTFTFENACGSVLNLTLSKYISERFHEEVEHDGPDYCNLE